MFILRACERLHKSLAITSRTSMRPLIRGIKKDHSIPSQEIKFEHFGVVKNRKGRIERFFDWSTTDEGRLKIGRAAVFWGTLTIAAFSWGFHINCVKWIRDAYISSSVEAPSIRQKMLGGAENRVGVLSEDYVKLFAKSQGRSGLSDESVKNVDLFYSTSLDPMSHGWTAMRQGAVVGFPRYYLQDKIDITNLRMKPFYNYFHKGYRIPSNLCDEAISDLEKVLHLTPEEREFVMCKELARVDGWGALREAVVYPIYWWMYYEGARQVNTRSILMKASRKIRWIFQAALGAGSLLLLLIFKSFHSFESEMNAVSAVCSTRAEAQVAVGYYQKLINRNKVLHQVLGEDGAYCFTPQGEFQPSWYEIGVGLQQRLDYCKSMEKELD